MYHAYFLTLGFFILIVIANIIPIFMLCCSKRLRRDVFYRGLISLCANAVAVAPLSFLLMFYSHAVSYKVWVFLRSLADVLGLQAYLHHLLISLERFCACRMTKYSLYFSRWRQVLYLFLTYVISVMSVIAVNQYNPLQVPQFTHSAQMALPTIRLVFSLLATFIILGVLVLTILSVYQLLRHLRNFRKVKNSELKKSCNKTTDNLDVFCVSNQVIQNTGSGQINRSIELKVVENEDNRKTSRESRNPSLHTHTIEPSSDIFNEEGRRLPISNQTRHRNVKSTKQREESAKTLLLVVTTLVLFNIPYHIVEMVSHFTEQSVSEQAISVTYYLSNFQFILNPIVYMWRIRPIRDIMKCRR
jgi:hypothetical protein